MPRLHFIPPLALAALAPLSLACGHKGQPAPPRGPVLPAPEPAPFDSSHIPDHSQWKSLGPPRPSHAGPHRGAFQRIYLNPVAARALDQNAFKPWPDGSQMVKEAFNTRGERLMFFWMSREQGQWVWATGDVNGKVAARFPGESSGACAACHTSRAEQFGGAFTPNFAGKRGLPRFPSP